MNFLSLLISTILEQRLDMLPTRERSYLANVHLDHIDQTVARRITKHRSFLVCRL